MLLRNFYGGINDITAVKICDSSCRYGNFDKSCKTVVYIAAQFD